MYMRTALWTMIQPLECWQQSPANGSISNKSKYVLRKSRTIHDSISNVTCRFFADLVRYVLCYPWSHSNLFSWFWECWIVHGLLNKGKAKRVNVTTQIIMTFMTSWWWHWWQMLVTMNQKLYFSPCHHGWGDVSENAAVTSQLLSCKAKSLWQSCCSLRLQTYTYTYDIQEVESHWHVFMRSASSTLTLSLCIYWWFGLPFKDLHHWTQCSTKWNCFFCISIAGSCSTQKTEASAVTYDVVRQCAGSVLFFKVKQHAQTGQLGIIHGLLWKMKEATIGLQNNHVVSWLDVWGKLNTNYWPGARVMFSFPPQPPSPVMNGWRDSSSYVRVYINVMYVHTRGRIPQTSTYNLTSLEFHWVILCSYPIHILAGKGVIIP